ncbi:MAG: flagellar motor protein MotB [Nitrospiraceae bacterium]|nr:flagellar motor protein MotB [Nitrospiraceae bacterium]
MKKLLVFPALSLLLGLAACGVPTAEHAKVVNDLADCAKRRDEVTVQANACKNQVANLTAENDALKKDKDALTKDKEGLQARVNELSTKAEKAEQLEKATQTYQDLQKKLEKEIQEGKIQLTEMKNRLTMTMVDKILFASGSAEVSREGKNVLDKVVPILKEIKDKRIQVEGHTDNVRIISAIKTRYPTNWELSTARATQVVRYLQEDGGIDPKVLSATGYAEYQPVAPNDSDENKAKNRRIEIVLLPLTQ